MNKARAQFTIAIAVLWQWWPRTVRRYAAANSADEGRNLTDGRAASRSAGQSRRRDGRRLRQVQGHARSRRGRDGPALVKGDWSGTRRSTRSGRRHSSSSRGAMESYRLVAVEYIVHQGRLGEGQRCHACRACTTSRWLCRRRRTPTSCPTSTKSTSGSGNRTQLAFSPARTPGCRAAACRSRLVNAVVGGDADTTVSPWAPPAVRRVAHCPAAGRMPSDRLWRYRPRPVAVIGLDQRQQTQPTGPSTSGGGINRAGHTQRRFPCLHWSYGG